MYTCTVNDLIARLQEFDGDRPVFFQVYTCGQTGLERLVPDRDIIGDDDNNVLIQADWN